MKTLSYSDIARPVRFGLFRSLVAARLERAGVALDGDRPFDPQIKNARALRRMVLGGSLGTGESYVEGEWECDQLDELASRVLAAGLDRSWYPWMTTSELFSRFFNRQSRTRARDGGMYHYDRGNDLYEAMLGPAMAYSCGYWRDADNLQAAQTAKHDLVCQKLKLRPGMRVLDIGCGWGGFAAFAAKHYGAEILGITISPSQAEFALSRCKGLSVRIELKDYRDIQGRFDRVVSIGMFEHVGPANYRRFFQAMQGALSDEGIALLHTIGGLQSVYAPDPWIDRYIFPNGVLPSAAQITRAVEDLLVIEDWHNFGADYDRTLLAWYANFEAAWPKLGEFYDERFYRTWRYYLLTCAGSFRARRNQLWQIVFSRRGIPGGYVRP